MRQKFVLWIEEYLFFPNITQKLVSYILLPLSFIYILVVFIKRVSAKTIDYKIPIISIGNIVVGGSGKTPLAIKLASKYSDAFVILRGYGRASKGLYLVSNKGEILVDVKTSGDEAMLLAQSLENSSVIVSEDRVLAIKKAKELGAKIIFLDDGFSKYSIKKFDILLRPKNDYTNNFCLPSGGYRELKSSYKKADLLLIDGVDFKRVVTLKSADDGQNSLLGKNTLLLTAISKPKRLLEFLPKNIELKTFEDHHNFTQDEIDLIIKEYEDFEIVTTLKDYVKLKEFNLKSLHLMHLEIEFKDNSIFDTIQKYINSY